MSDSKWLTRAEATAYTKRPSLDAFDWWVRSRGIRAEGRCGRLPLYTRDQLDRVLRHDAASRGLRKLKRSA